MSDYRDYEFSAKAISAFAYRVQRRLFSAGDHSTSVDDIKQELTIPWMKAVEKFDPAQGVPFLAYLRRGMSLYINRYLVLNLERRHDEVIAHSLDFQIDTEDGQATFADVVATEDPSVEDTLAEAEAFELVLRRLSPNAQRMLELMRAQPRELLAEVHRLEDRSRYAREQGVTIPHQHELTSRLVCEVLGLTVTEQRTIIGEIKSVSKAVARELQ